MYYGDLLDKIKRCIPDAGRQVPVVYLPVDTSRTRHLPDAILPVNILPVKLFAGWPFAGRTNCRTFHLPDAKCRKAICRSGHLPVGSFCRSGHLPGHLPVGTFAGRRMIIHSCINWNDLPDGHLPDGEWSFISPTIRMKGDLKCLAWSKMSRSGSRRCLGQLARPNLTQTGQTF